MKWTKHPVFRVPSSEAVRAFAEKMNLPAQEAARQIWVKREGLIRDEKRDPLRFGYEPRVWRWVDALLGLPWMPEEEAAQIRKELGFEAPVKCVLINGGNRSGKSEYAAKRTVLMLLHKEAARAWCYHETNQMSIENQQPVIYKYLPEGYRERDVREKVTYVAYKLKTGFSEGAFTLKNSSMCVFRNYEQLLKTAEGGELDWCWCDELAGPDLVDTLQFRLATRDGRMVVTFTPVEGYSSTVKMFRDGARPTVKEWAWLLPTDNGEPDEERALVGCAEHPEGRTFERANRVLRCKHPTRGVVFFFPVDNPYGNPRAVLEKVRGARREKVLERWYGDATRQMTMKFPKFGDAHIVPAKAIPEKGTNYLIVDPASGRNFFWAYWRVTPEGQYVVREWPGNYEIPGYGFPGPWAVPDGKHPDGKAGEGQHSFGMSLLEYKREWARAEGWTDAGEDGEGRVVNGRRLPIEEWDEGNGARMPIERRIIDSRFAGAGRLNAKEQPLTLIEEFEEIGVSFDPAPGDDVKDGVTLINNLLAYDTQRPVSFLNKPKLFVCEECENVIFALQTWTGDDGQKGATRDPVDVVRYGVLSDLEYVDERRTGGVPGGAVY